MCLTNFYLKIQLHFIVNKIRINGIRKYNKLNIKK